MRLNPGLLAALLALGAPARAEWQFTVADDLTLGKDRYTANTLDLAAAPTREFGGDLSVGVNRTSSPVKDSSNAGGIGAWFNVGSRSSVSLNGSRYQGMHGAIYDPAGTYLGDASDRQVSSSLAGNFTYAFVKPGSGSEEGGFSLSGSAGLFFGGHAVPVWTQTPGGLAVHHGDYRIGDRGLTTGVTLGYGNTSGGLSGRFHRYDFPIPAAMPPRIFLHLLNTSVTSAVYGLPKSETTLFLAQRFLGSLTADLSATFETLSTDLDVETAAGRSGKVTITGITPVAEERARTVGLTLSWDAASWLTLRAGGSSTRQESNTTTYGEAGVSTFF